VQPVLRVREHWQRQHLPLLRQQELHVRAALQAWEVPPPRQVRLLEHDRLV